MNTQTNRVVSVIVPARNEEACLASCLESLVSQRGIDFEIIVVDDASIDRTGEIARAFAFKRNLRSTKFGRGTTSSRAEQGPTLTYGTAESRALTGPEPTHGEDARGSTNDVGEVRPRPADFLVDESPRVAVIPAGPLPNGWTGKNNAMSVGARIAKGKWLLFTDADTIHKTGSLARAVAEAEQHGAALLSYSPEQEVRGFREKAVMPVIFSELAATYPPKKVNDPASPVAAANGQYLLISRDAYDAVGGHAKIASDLLEDVAMARLVKSSGRKIFFRYGGDAVRTRMYRSWSQMKEGWTKNLALLFPKPSELAQRRFGEFVLLSVLPWMLLPKYWRAFSSGFPPLWFKWYVLILGGWAFVAFILTGAEFIRRMRKARFSWWSIAYGFLGLPIFAYLLLRSARSYKKSRFYWKDRTYVYTPEEVETLNAARFSEEGDSSWKKFTAWISSHSRT
jgi:glycosyltransferase involved in cell wall biosynthesis